MRERTDERKREKEKKEENTANTVAKSRISDSEDGGLGNAKPENGNSWLL